MKKLLCLLLGGLAGAAQAQMPRMDLTIGFYRIETEVAADLKNRMQGLMGRRALAPQQGMLFVFPEVARHCMWMKNTFLPLSVAFLDEDGKIINIEDMQPETLDSHCAAKPARFALEMNQGWFAGKGIKPGSRLAGLGKVPPPQ
ncbi:MAG: hypothetical protein H6R10_1861 [Rhodocyclaceae bacterium]|nr:hypothetical protein [Rhodocyclaceae bacterium]